MTWLKKLPPKGVGFFHPLPQLPLWVYKQCYTLNFRNCGTTRLCLVKYKKRWDAFAFCVASQGKILGWALITPGRVYGQWRASFYVRQKYRKIGIGSYLRDQILQFAKTHCTDVGFFPHDKASKGLLKKAKTETQGRSKTNAFEVWDTPYLCVYQEGGKWRFPSPWHHPRASSRQPKRRAKEPYKTPAEG